LDVDLPADDPRVERARSLLEGSGMKLANPFRMREDDEYSLQYERTYEPADLEVVELLEPGVHVDFDADYKDATGRVLLRTDSIRSGHEIGLAAAHWYVVSDRLRRDLEAAFPGKVAFRETVPISGKWGAHKVRQDQVGAWWEMTSGVTMPPADRSRLVDANGEPYTGDDSRGCYPVDGLYKPAELHYARAAIAAMPSFAVAMTREKFGPGRMPAQLPVVTQAFYRFCTGRKLKMRWTPVRIDG
jgi:hypothetical protein